MTLDEKILFRSLCDLNNHRPKLLSYFLDKLLEQQPHRRGEDFTKAVMILLQGSDETIPDALSKIDDDYKAVYLHALGLKE